MNDFDLVKVPFKSEAQVDSFVTTYNLTLGADCWGINTTYAIRHIASKTIVGYISFKIEKYKNGRRIMCIGGIEILEVYRGKGLFKQFILNLFSTPVDMLYQLSSIYGESIWSAIPAWKSIGANFDVSNKKIQEALDNRYSLCFTLSRAKFLDACKRGY